MRKRLLFIMFALAAGFAANAESVPVAVAGSRAAAFLHLNGESQLQQLKSPYETMYLFAIQGGGFVIVSADNRVQPILGYSLESNLDVDNLPANLAGWLEGYDSEIRAAMRNDRLPVHAGWLKGGCKSVEGFDSTVGPLMTTLWDQSPRYNNLCPMRDGELTLTGCIATAMAQIMKYWNWPDTGAGQHSFNDYHYGTLSADFGATAYDWANMPTSLTAMSSQAEIDAVATLMYHCGVSMDMEYNIAAHGGSGVSTSGFVMGSHGLSHVCTENALRNNFKYSFGISSTKRSRYSQDEWMAIIKNEIDHGRPILYGAFDDATTYGHSFVCDGYDTNGWFHFNWGWGGLCDGFFSLFNLNPNGDNYNGEQWVIIGIEPDSLYGSGISCTVNAASADTSMGTVTGGGVFGYRDTVTITAVPNQGYRFDHWNDNSIVNPYPFLAHDMSLTAYFAEILAENDEAMSYTGTNVNSIGLYTLRSNDRIGIKLPASALPGHNYLSAIEAYVSMGDFVVCVHRGGDDAPGPVVYTQPASIPSGSIRWNRVKFETPVAIDTTENLWVTIRPVNLSAFWGCPGLGVPDGNWVSTDNGATWQHLTDVEPSSQLDDMSICWYIRCITATDSVAPTNLAPTAFLLAPEKANIGDTVEVELLRSTSSTVVWDFGDADFSSAVSDTALVVWNTEGLHDVGASVSNVGGTVNLNATLRISDCGTPVSTFPYVINFSQQDESLRACWQFLYYGEVEGYYLGTDYISVLFSSRTDDWFVSPLIDLGGGQPLGLTVRHSTPSNCSITVELSQGGLDSSDFTTIYTLPESSSVINSGPINLSEHYQGNPVRVAIRMHGTGGTVKFDLMGLRIEEGVGINDLDVQTSELSVTPNPACGVVTVGLPDVGGTLAVYDMTGRLVMQFETESGSAAIDTRSMPQGMYLIKYTSPQGTATTQVVVQ